MGLLDQREFAQALDVAIDRARRNIEILRELIDADLTAGRNLHHDRQATLERGTGLREFADHALTVDQRALPAKVDQAMNRVRPRQSRRL